MSVTIHSAGEQIRSVPGGPMVLRARTGDVSPPDPWRRREPTLQTLSASREAGCTCGWSGERTLLVVDPRCPVAERHIP